MTTDHSTLMGEALTLARLGVGRTRPNPPVGAVVVRDGRIIGRGFHRRAGLPHAEVEAIQDATEPVDGAEIYVTLEPCCHHGRTPPCTDALISAGIRRVYVGCEDPNPEVQGRGIERLRDAGVDVVLDVEADRCRALISAYRSVIERGRPLVTAKWAMTLDGKIATASGSSQWISGPQSRARVHELRDAHDAVLVGARTARLDDPQLNCRREGGRDPLRVVLDGRLELGPDRKVFASPGTIVVAAEAATTEAEARLAQVGAQVVRVPILEEGRLDLNHLLTWLSAEHDVMSLLVEGGGVLLGSLFDLGLVDAVQVFVAPKIAGGQGAPSPVGGLGASEMSAALALQDVQVERVGHDILVSGNL